MPIMSFVMKVYRLISVVGVQEGCIEAEVILDSSNKSKNLYKKIFQVEFSKISMELL